MNLQIRKMGAKFVVVGDLGKVAGPFAFRSSAVVRMNALLGGAPEHARPARETVTRACLCCERPFQSEGAHNRLCVRCRTKDGEMAAAYGFSAPRRSAKLP